MLLNRRTLLQAGAALSLGQARAESEPQLDPVPPLPQTPTQGRPGDFDFLAGQWRIDNLRRTAEGWDRFEGESTCWTILGGVGSVEELRIPARQFAGMGLRLLDVEKRQWMDHWVNAKSGALGAAGQPGSFENGAGLFSSVDESSGKPVIWVGIWDQITPSSCRWRQASSADGGKTWVHDWLMHWRRR